MAGRSVRHPAQNLSDILLGSGFNAWVEENRRFHSAGHDGYHEAAAMLKDGFTRYGNRLLLGWDVKMPAKRITKLIVHAGDLEAQCATMLSSAYALYQQSFAVRLDNRDRKAFDPTK